MESTGKSGSEGESLMSISQQEYETMLARLQPNASAQKKPKKTRGMNGTESEFAAKLEVDRRAGAILYWAFEPVHFRLAQGASFKPDFMVVDRIGSGFLIEFLEVKGFWRESARVRIKVAAEVHPFRFYAVRKKKGGGWEYESFPGLVDRL